MSNIVRNKFPALYKAYLLVAEPRVVRLILFVIYSMFITAGLMVLTNPPENFEEILSTGRVAMMACFLILGGILSAVAVLPGLWWLERCGIISLITGMVIYIVLIIGVSNMPIALCISIAFILFFIIRYMETRQFKLAPRKN